ncbi:OmpH family outer membrane protein [Zhouia sp. PK063]|uniref:OmpH family outer membrane protein n=1 Tax=Zhouia sp. PK063 TaxID=3373602 RepID=UPI0037B90AA1
MKKSILLITAVLLSISLNAQRSVRIGYVDMEYILQNVEEYQLANQQLNNKVEKWKKEIEQLNSTIDQKKKNLSAEKVLLTPELLEEKEDEIKVLEKQLSDYQQKRFGPEGDLVKQQQLLVKPIQDQVFNAVQDIATNKNYDFVFDKSADVVMLYSNKKYDISDLVLRRINVDRKQNKNAANSALGTFEEKNPELEKREQAAEDRKTEREQLIEDKRKKALEEREARKKAYEERRQKILEEREAKRKAKLEERKKADEKTTSPEEEKTEKEGDN